VNIDGQSALVTGGASGLGLATARRLAGHGARVTIVDLPGEAAERIANDLRATYAPADVRSADELGAAVETAAASNGVPRIVVHCAGRGGTVRLVDRDGEPGSLEVFSDVIAVNLIGTFNVLRLTAAQMARTEPIDDERGVVVLTASVAAYEGQVGQIPYASAKAGIVGMTLVAARDLALHQIRVATIAPGIFDTPLLARVPDNVRDALGQTVPHPRRLGRPEEFAQLATAIVENPMLNGETIRLDGAIRMAPR